MPGRRRPRIKSGASLRRAACGGKTGRAASLLCGGFGAQEGEAGVEAGECFCVVDSDEHDIAGARALGMQTVLIHEGDLEAPGSGLRAEAHHRIGTLSELLPIVEARA